MSTQLFIAGLLIFFAAFVAVEALYTWWSSSHSAESKRIAQRLSAMSAVVGEASDSDVTELIKKRARSAPDSLEGRLSSSKTTGFVHRLLVESASEWTVTGFLAFTSLMSIGAVFIAMVLRYSALAGVIAGSVLFILPFMYLSFRRDRRRRRFEAQLPSALDMIGRALRAGHSFASAMNVAGSELSEPIGPELKMTYDEINFGIPPATALENLARRVPSQDLSFFVIAAIIQRETGGNLAEVLDNISGIIRSRLKLFGKIRAVSAEGKLSALVLSVLPLVTGLMMYSLNPDLTRLLWTDPTGIKLIYIGITMTFIGIVWMRQVIKIHV